MSQCSVWYEYTNARNYWINWRKFSYKNPPKYKNQCKQFSSEYKGMKRLFLLNQIWLCFYKWSPTKPIYFVSNCVGKITKTIPATEIDFHIENMDKIEEIKSFRKKRSPPESERSNRFWLALKFACRQYVDNTQVHGFFYLRSTESKGYTRFLQFVDVTIIKQGRNEQFRTESFGCSW